VQQQIVLQSQRVHDAARSIEWLLMKRQEINSKRFPMAAAYGSKTESSMSVVETDEELGADVEYSTGFDTGVDETDAGAVETTASEVTAAGGQAETRPRRSRLTAWSELGTLLAI
jgi:hypothetical protein